MHSAVRPFTDAVARYTSTSQTSEATPEVSSGTPAEPADAEDTAETEMDQDTEAQDVAEEPVEGEQLPATGGNLLGLLIAGVFSFAAAGLSRRR